MESSTEKNEISRLIDIIENLNSRLSAIESASTQVTEKNTSIQKPEYVKESSEDFEFRMGEQWFGKIGVVAFTFAFFYLLTLTFNRNTQTTVMLLGFIVSAIILIVSFVYKNQLKTLSGYLTGSGIIILFFSFLKLHYFTDSPIIASRTLMIFILFAVSTGAAYMSLKKMSPALMMITFLLFGNTALLSDDSVIIFITLTLMSTAIVYLQKKYNWESLVLFAIPLTYVFYFLWSINNPLSGRAITTIEVSPLSIMFVPLYLSIYGFTQIRKKENDIDNYDSVLKSLFNSVMGYLLFIYLTLNNQMWYSPLLHFGMSLLLLAIAARYWIIEKSKISTFLYSMAGYGALSFSIILNFKSPDLYILLCWQSLLVVSTALWFRSRFIVVANFFIFFILLLTYVILWGKYDIESLSFGLVALISARLINVHQQRLELQSEQLRNAYLIITMIFIPYVLYAILPGYIVGISWIVLAFVYYVVGKLINNKKYRLMASGTLIMSLAYIFIFGLTNGDATFKILSFLLVSIALIIISVVYSRVHSKEITKV
ncbi:MAG: DUF2339 domain-containing protein [Syntrophothermus sp.]